MHDQLSQKKTVLISVRTVFFWLCRRPQPCGLTGGAKRPAVWLQFVPLPDSSIRGMKLFRGNLSVRRSAPPAA